MKKTLLTYLSFCALGSTLMAQNFTKTTINANTGANPYALAAGFLDGDAYLDLAIGTDGGNTVEWYRNNGNGTFAAGITLVATAPNDLLFVEGITIADINGDGDNDILATSFGNDNLVWFENNGDSTFQDAVTIVNGIDSPGAVMAVNLDNDANGYLDLVVAIYGNDGDTDSLIYLLGNGDGTFGTTRFIVPETAGLGTGDFDLADFDGDGDIDVLVSFADAGNVEIYDSRLVQDGVDGGGNIPFVKYTNSVNTGNGYLFDISFADLNDDGNLDIIKSDNLPGANPGIVWYTNDISGTGTTFTAHPVTTTIARSAIAAVADINNDTYNDLLVTNGRVTDNDVIWFASDAVGGLGTETTIDNSQNAVYDMVIVDFDNDGDLDFATVSYLQNDLNLFLNDLITLSVDQQTVETISMYPNPTKDKLYFKMPSQDSFSVSVYTILGKKVIEKTIENTSSLDVSNLADGVYIIKFNTYNETFKFIKQ